MYRDQSIGCQVTSGIANHLSNPQPPPLILFRLFLKCQPTNLSIELAQKFNLLKIICHYYVFVQWPLIQERQGKSTGLTKQLESDQLGSPIEIITFFYVNRPITVSHVVQKIMCMGKYESMGELLVKCFYDVVDTVKVQ